MNRRHAIKTLGATIVTPALVTSTGAADGDNEGQGMQPIEGELPNEHVPEASLSTLPPFFGTEDTTREAGTFLTLTNGWAGVTDKTETFLNSTRQTFTYADQTFILDSVDDWIPRDDGSYYFAHTDPPYPKGETVEVSWDVIFTDSFIDPIDETQYEEGDRYIPSLFPTSRTYEIVRKDGGNR